MTVSVRETKRREELGTTSFDRLQDYLGVRKITTIKGIDLDITIQERDGGLFVFIGPNKRKPTDFLYVTQESLVAHRRNKFTNIAGFGFQPDEEAPEWIPHLVCKKPNASYQSGVGKLIKVIGNVSDEAKRIKRERLARQMQEIIDKQEA